MSTTSRVDPLSHEVRPPIALAWSLQMVIVILIPVVIVLGAVRLLASDQYLALEYNRSDFPPDGFGFAYADRLSYASVTVRYMRDGLSLKALADLQWADRPSIFVCWAVCFLAPTPLNGLAQITPDSSHAQPAKPVDWNHHSWVWPPIGKGHHEQT